VKKIAEKKRVAVARAPVVDQQFITHPEGVPKRGARWPIPPAVSETENVEPRGLAALEAQLAHYVQTSCAIHGLVDLTDLVCDMLDDDAGRAWGLQARIRMNHFVYARTVWHGRDAEESAPTLRRLQNYARVEAARRLHPWLLRRPWIKARLDGADRVCPGWQARLNWIYRQYDTAGLAMPARYRIGQGEYAPQPFEQAIKVSRAEGREDYAIHFEVEKQKVEWQLFNRRHWIWLTSLGLLSALLWLILTNAETRDRWLIAALLAIGIAGVSHAANFAMRFMFGYLRRPVRAIASLVAAFLIGWAGVHMANVRHLMVIDVEPVATVAFKDKEEIRLASEVKNETSARDVHCGGEISEGLYALDVLIPLIDLREENRCEIGSAQGREKIGPIEPAWVDRLFGRMLNSERFWVAAKALYAIAGWFIVSLSILTFAHANRTRGDPAGG
jgi:hypothetical protein